jgi:hypothetical protein
LATAWWSTRLYLIAALAQRSRKCAVS